MFQDGQKMWTDEMDRDGRTDDAKTIFLRLRRGVISSVACGSSSIKIDCSDHPKSLISRINEFYVLSII